MSQDDPTRVQPAVEAPSVTTAPAQGAPSRGRWHLSRLPSHLGRARTSTLVLSALFLAIGALYLNIRPEVPSATPTSGTSVEQPAPAPTTTPPAPETTSEPPPTTEAPTTTDAPATTTAPTETPEPTEPATPEETTEPTTSAVPPPTSRAGTPPTTTPPG